MSSGIGDVTRRSARVGRPLEPDRHLRRVTAVELDRLDVTPNPAGLRMLVHIPDHLAPGAPLVVVLHGCGQTAAEHAARAGWLALADRYRFAVLAPEQTLVNNFNRCFNWHRANDGLHPSAETSSILAMIDRAIALYRTDPRRVFITGLSAGGAMAMAVLAVAPRRFAAAAVVAGVPFGVAGNLIEAMGAMRRAAAAAAVRAGRSLRPRMIGIEPPRLAIWQGAADEVVDPANADAIAAQWAAACGLDNAPERVDAGPGMTRRVWRATGGRQAIIEETLVAGLGHGTPIGSFGPGAVGAAGRFMLQAAVSAPRDICQFWGIDAAADVTIERPPRSCRRKPGPIRRRRRPRVAAREVVSVRPWATWSPRGSRPWASAVDSGHGDRGRHRRWTCRSDWAKVISQAEGYRLDRKSCSI